MATDDSQQPEESSSGLTETLKKVLTLGAGAAFMTEESIRSYLGEMKLPKDILSSVLQGAGKSKEEIVQRVSSELVKILKQADLAEEMSRFAREHKFKISAELEFEKKDKKDLSS